MGADPVLTVQLSHDGITLSGRHVCVCRKSQQIIAHQPSRGSNFCFFLHRLPGRVWGFCGQGSGGIFWVRSFTVQGGCTGSSSPGVCGQVADLICFSGREKKPQDLAPLFLSSLDGIIYPWETELQTSTSGPDHQHLMSPLLPGQRTTTHFSRGLCCHFTDSKKRKGFLSSPGRAAAEPGMKLRGSLHRPHVSRSHINQPVLLESDLILQNCAQPLIKTKEQRVTAWRKSRACCKKDKFLTPCTPNEPFVGVFCRCILKVPPQGTS